MTEQLGKTFSIPAAKFNKVIFVGESKGAKVKDIRDHRIQLFYGDADGDIRDAREVGAEAIRVLRPQNSSNHPIPRNGAMGEKVLINSDF